MVDVAIEAGRAVRTRHALLNAGFDLLVDRPIDLVSINDLVATAGVAKGSFFNHFVNKHDFAETIAANIRLEMEDAIGRANAAVVDLVERLSRGMQIPVEFALSQPKRARVMLRAAARTTLQDHPLNRGVRADIKACAAQGKLRREGASSGMMFWLGVCQATTRNIMERDLPRASAADEMRNVLILALSGLGVEVKRVAQLAAAGRRAIRKGLLRPYLKGDVS